MAQPFALDYPEMNMYDLVRQAALAHPRSAAYVFQGKRTDYTRLLARVEAAAKGLYRLGIRRGDRVTLCLPNCPQMVDCLYALNRIGAVANLIHPLSAGSEIAFYLQVSESKAILTLDTFYEKVAGVLPRLEKPCHVLVTSISQELPFPLNILYPLTPAGRCRLPKEGYTLWQDVLRQGQALAQLPEETSDPSDCAVILYSGGTTGTPKGVRLSNRNLNALALQTVAASGFGSISGMKMLAVLPNFHGFGLGVGIHTAIIGGASCILVPQFTVKTYARILLRQKPNIVPGVPTLFEALLRCRELEGKDLSFLKGIFCGGDSLSPALKARVDAFLQQHHCPEQIREGYGATECVAAACLTPRHYARPGSIGLPYPDMQVQIVRPGTTQPLPPGSRGEICLQGPTVMLGYLNQPEENADALQTHADGNTWLHTGDLGYMDADGFVYFTQRIKRMIVTSGYNVYPSQLEQILDGHEAVAACCVIGVPDAYRGQRVRAYVVPEKGIEPTQQLKDRLRQHCAGQIAKYALPREICFREALPKTLLGKVDYRALEQEALEEN